MTEHPKITRVRVYRDSAGEWRSTAYSSNGDAIFVSSEGYVNREDATGAASGAFPDAEIREEIEGGEDQ